MPTANYQVNDIFYRIITYVSSPALVCNIGEGINISMLMLYVFCV